VAHPHLVARDLQAWGPRQAVICNLLGVLPTRALASNEADQHGTGIALGRGQEVNSMAALMYALLVIGYGLSVRALVRQLHYTPGGLTARRPRSNAPRDAGAVRSVRGNRSQAVAA